MVDESPRTLAFDCEERLTWLADHGYEIANHTW